MLSTVTAASSTTFYPFGPTEVGIHVCQMVDITKRYVEALVTGPNASSEVLYLFRASRRGLGKRRGTRATPLAAAGGVSGDDERVCNSWLVNKPKNEREYADGNTALGGGGVRSARPGDISRTGNPSGAPFLLSAGPGGQSATLRTYTQIMAHMYAKPNVEMPRIPRERHLEVGPVRRPRKTRLAY